MSAQEPEAVDDNRGPSVGAIIVAAGHSRRMGGPDKIFIPLLGHPLIEHTVRAFVECAQVGTIVVVMAPESIDEGRRLVEQNAWHKVKDICAGGERRQDSVDQGIQKLLHTDWIVVHDGARPCADADMIARGLQQAQETGAAVAAVPVRDTIKSAGPDLAVTHTLTRDTLWAVQTPQVFRTDLLVKAHQHVSEDVTDDASMVERIGGVVRLFMGSHENIKVTTPEDVLMVEAILKVRPALTQERSL